MPGQPRSRFSKKNLLRSVLALSLAVVSVSAVKRSDFKTCAQSGFCTRQRAFADLVREASGESQPWSSPYRLEPSSLLLQGGILKGDLVMKAEQDQKPSFRHANKLSAADLTFELHLLENDAVRIRINERNPLSPRYDGVEAAVLVKPYGFAQDSNYKQLKASGEGSADGSLSIQYGKQNQNTVKITTEPFKIEFFANGVSTVVLNEEGLLRLERTQKKAESEGLTDQQGDEESALLDDVNAVPKSYYDKLMESSQWDEQFKEFSDSKPKGPEALGLDISFPGASHVYGIPEHATSLSLKATRGPGAPYTDPYRLYNLDVFEYETDNPMALYGSIPFMMAQTKAGPSAVFWMNAAETWVDVEKVDKSGVRSWIKKKTDAPTTKTHWFSESGLVDVFVFLGPTHKDIFGQYSSLVGTTALPQAFSIAYHQCRWNYNTSQDVAEVDAGFDEHDIPYDVLWLDIEHTDGKRYFTWDESKFPDPIEMQQGLSFKGRKMVTIIDPHIKVDSGYHVSKEGGELDIFIKKQDGTTFDGWCWPGNSQWVDYFNPKAVDWWASNFKYDKYTGSTKSLFTWNDMNEPSVFSGPEITIPKDVVHYGDVEHRNVHNLFGTQFHAATAQGLINRNETRQRPFVLSRAFYAGTQRHGAIWTGDNLSTWEHLEIASPMLLTIGLAGLPFSGADVGGFFGNPEPELLSRWYQAGIYYPFFRAHAHLDAKRREPWLFGEPYTSEIREAIRTRYAFLPLWYTLFQETSINGMPIIRPMFVNYPEDEALYGMDDQYMVGEALLVKPVVKPRVLKSNVYFAGNEKWFDIKDYSVEQGPGYRVVNSPAGKIPVYQRAGAIVPKRERVRRTSKAMENDPFTLVIAIDSKGEAKGSLYIDDGESYAYENGAFILREFTLSNNVLSSKNVAPDSPSQLSTEASDYLAKVAGLRVERLVILGVTKPLTKITIAQEGGMEGPTELPVVCETKTFACIVKDPKLKITSNWSVTFA